MGDGATVDGSELALGPWTYCSSAVVAAAAAAAAAERYVVAVCSGSSGDGK